MNRFGFIGGSDMTVIMGVAPWKSPYTLWEEKTHRKHQEDISGLPQVIRGVDNEPIARERFIELKGIDFFSTKVTDHDVPYFVGNLDGMSYDEKHILEIKCMGKEKHEDVKRGIMPDIYKPQVQWYLMLSKAESCFFVSYRPEDDTLHYIEVFPNPIYHNELRQKATVFMNNILDDTEPEEGKPLPFIEKDSIKMLQDDYIYTVGLIRELELKKKMIKDELLQHGEYQTDKISVKKQKRKGGLDSKLMIVDGIDIEKYRKADSESTIIRVKKLTEE